MFSLVLFLSRPHICAGQLLCHQQNFPPLFIAIDATATTSDEIEYLRHVQVMSTFVGHARVGFLSGTGLDLQVGIF
jgi:hypothetical protein